MYIASYYVLTIHVFSVVIIIKYSRQITVLYMYIYIYIYTQNINIILYADVYTYL